MVQLDYPTTYPQFCSHARRIALNRISFKYIDLRSDEHWISTCWQREGNHNDDFVLRAVEGGGTKGGQEEAGGNKGRRWEQVLVILFSLANSSSPSMKRTAF